MELTMNVIFFIERAVILMNLPFPCLFSFSGFLKNTYKISYNKTKTTVVQKL